MSFWSRFANAFRAGRASDEIDEELQSHIEEAVAQGRDPAEARKAFGSALRYREQSRDIRVFGWLDSLRADVVYGLRQIRKNRVTSAAAIVSLALATGACTGAFRLIDAFLLRPMPIRNAGRLYAMQQLGTGPDGSLRETDSNEYPQFLLMRSTVKADAELVAASWANRADLTFSSEEAMEKANLQFVSGWMFNAFGLTPVLGRLLTENDDLKPKAHAYAVLSYDYWANRFGRDPHIIGHTFRQGNDLYQIIGVAPKGFTGTEPGTFTDIFLPAMMYPGVTHDDWSWIRTFILMKPGGSVERVRNQLQAVWTAVQSERAKDFKDWPPDRLRNYLKQQILVEPAATGLSDMRKSYQVALWVLAVLVGLVLLIACANVANLLTAQATARAREMALRVSIGAGRRRLIQLMLIESALLSLMSVVLGAVLAWWSAPFVISMISTPDNPARVDLSVDVRVLAFTLVLSVIVTFVFGLIPALRASNLQPAHALKGGSAAHAQPRIMYGLIVAQVAVCFVVQLAASDFVLTLNHLTQQPVGFSADRLLTLETLAKPAQPVEIWNQLADQLRSLSGVESVAIAGWPLLSNNGSNGFVSVNGAPPHPLLAYFLNVSPGWLATMKIPLLAGRDLRLEDLSPGMALVNTAFSKEYFNGENPIGRAFNRGAQQYRVVGLVADARYRNLREPIIATAYLPMRYPAPESLSGATFLVRTTDPNPLKLAPVLRREISRTRSEFRVSNIRTQLEINRAQTVRERLLSGLASFFGGVAILLTCVGVYGVLDFSILRRRKELGIRIALGAPAADIIQRVTFAVSLMIIVGTLIGAASALLLAPKVKTLLYQVQSSDLASLAPVLISLVGASLLAIAPAVIRALKIDAASLLREE